MIDDTSDKLTSEDMEDRNPKPFKFVDYDDPIDTFAFVLMCVMAVSGLFIFFVK